MLSEIAYYQILGKPLIMYVGIFTLLLFGFVALTGYMSTKGKRFLPFVWHKRLAIIALILGLIHGIFGLSFYL